MPASLVQQQKKIEISHSDFQKLLSEMSSIKSSVTALTEGKSKKKSKKIESLVRRTEKISGIHVFPFDDDDTKVKIVTIEQDDPDGTASYIIVSKNQFKEFVKKVHDGKVKNKVDFSEYELGPSVAQYIDDEEGWTI